MDPCRLRTHCRGPVDPQQPASAQRLLSYFTELREFEFCLVWGFYCERTETERVDRFYVVFVQTGVIKFAVSIQACGPPRCLPHSVVGWWSWKKQVALKLHEGETAESTVTKCFTRPSILVKNTPSIENLSCCWQNRRGLQTDKAIKTTDGKQANQ